ncbi:MAG: hypothetical protein ACI82F_000142 [Planctomycetota bacterium]|jgi:hypothetical protein
MWERILTLTVRFRMIDIKRRWVRHTGHGRTSHPNTLRNNWAQR